MLNEGIDVEMISEETSKTYTDIEKGFMKLELAIMDNKINALNSSISDVSSNLDSTVRNMEENALGNKLRKTLDIKRLERLYSSYKNKKSKIRKIQEEMEKEEGITFKPYINTENSFYQKEFSEKKSEILNSHKSERYPNHFKSQKSLDIQNKKALLSQI